MNKQLRPLTISNIFNDILDEYRITHLGMMSLFDFKIQKYLLSIPDDIAGASINSSFPKEDLILPIKDIINQIKYDQQQSPQVLAKVSFATLARVFIIYAYKYI